MATTDFSSGTVIASSWLNDINDWTYQGRDISGIHIINASDSIYGAVGDGITDDTAAVTSVIAAAVLTNSDVFWPRVYLTTASIPNLHTVRHTGPGAIKRGSNLFYLDPKNTQTNTLFVSASGASDANDGIGTGQPIATFTKAIQNFTSLRTITNPCIIQATAGTYSGSFVVPDYQAQADGYLTIKGATTATVTTTPTTIVDCTGLIVNAGIDVGRGNKVKLQDLLIQKMDGAVDQDCIQAGIGTVVWLQNCQSLDATARSLLVLDRASQGYVQGGGKIGGKIGIDCYSGSTLTVGYNATSTANSTFMRSTTQAAFYLKSHVHVVSNYGDYTDNALVVFGYHNARFDTKGDDFKRNTRVFKMLGSYVSDNITPTSVYNYGGTDANSIVEEFDQYSAYDIYHAGGRGGLDVAHSRVTTTITGTVAATKTRALHTIGAYKLTTTGKYIEVECVVTGTGAAGTKTVTLQLGSTVVGTYTLATGTVTGIIRAKIWANNTTSCVVINEVSGSLTLVTPTRAVPAVTFSADQELAVWIAVPGAADTASLQESRCVLWG